MQNAGHHIFVGNKNQYFNENKQDRSKFFIWILTIMWTMLVDSMDTMMVYRIVKSVISVPKFESV